MSEPLKLWFFRDLTDEQRLKLFGLFGLPVDEIGKVHGHQAIALRHITQKLVEMVRHEASCTCHPDDSPPVPCAKRYALSDCVAVAGNPVAYRHRLAGSREWNLTNADDMDGVRECERHLVGILEVEALFVRPAQPLASTTGSASGMQAAGAELGTITGELGPFDPAPATTGGDHG